MTAVQTQEAENYWRHIKDTSYEVKLWLINKLSFSLIERTPSQITGLSDDQLRTKDFIDEFAGCWKSDVSAEDIIRLVKENPSCKNPPIVF